MDGLICVLHTFASKLRIFQLITYFKKGTLATQPEVMTARARKITISTIKGTFPAHRDGETLCYSGDKLDVGLLPKRLEFIITG